MSVLSPSDATTPHGYRRGTCTACLLRNQPVNHEDYCLRCEAKVLEADTEAANRAVDFASTVLEEALRYAHPDDLRDAVMELIDGSREAAGPASLAHLSVARERNAAAHRALEVDRTPAAVA